MLRFRIKVLLISCSVFILSILLSFIFSNDGGTSYDQLEKVESVFDLVDEIDSKNSIDNPEILKSEVLGESEVEYENIDFPRTSQTSGSFSAPNKTTTNNNSTPTPSVSSYIQRRDIANQVIAAVNGERSKLGLTSLSVGLELTNMAESHSLEMAKAGKLLGHTNLASRQKSFGVLPPATNAGENEALFSTSTSANEVVAKWMESSTHRENIVNPIYTKIGVGVVEYNGILYYSLEVSN